MEQLIETVVTSAGGDGYGRQARAARVLGITRARLGQIIKAGYVPYEQWENFANASNGEVTLDDFFEASKAA